MPCESPCDEPAYASSLESPGEAAPPGLMAPAYHGAGAPASGDLAAASRRRPSTRTPALRRLQEVTVIDIFSVRAKDFTPESAPVRRHPDEDCTLRAPRD